MSNSTQIPDGFAEFVDAWNNDDLPDGAWWAMLEEGVAAYNKEYGTAIDLNDGVHHYLKSKD